MQPRPTRLSRWGFRFARLSIDLQGPVLGVGPITSKGMGSQQDFCRHWLLDQVHNFLSAEKCIRTLASRATMANDLHIQGGYTIPCAIYWTAELDSARPLQVRGAYTTPCANYLTAETSSVGPLRVRGGHDTPRANYWAADIISGGPLQFQGLYNIPCTICWTATFHSVGCLEVQGGSKSAALTLDGRINRIWPPKLRGGYNTPCTNYWTAEWVDYEWMCIRRPRGISYPLH